MIPPEEEAVDNGELWALAEAVCNGTIGAEQYARLNALLLADEAAARRYATYVRMHGLLLWRWQGAEAAAPPPSRLFRRSRSAAVGRRTRSVGSCFRPAAISSPIRWRP